MITDLGIENLRGVRRGTLAGLGPLVVLVGPNGCGKSTVLDALFLVGADDPGQAAASVVQRRPAAVERRDLAVLAVGSTSKPRSARRSR